MGTIFGFVVAAALALPISGFGPVCAGSDLLPTITSPTCVSQGDLGGDGFAEASDDDDARGSEGDDDRRGNDGDSEDSDRRPSRGNDDGAEGKADEKEPPKRGDRGDSGGSEGGDNERAVGGDRDGF